MSHQCVLPSEAPYCTACGRRLFLEREVQDRRPVYFWYCATGCSRRYPFILPNGNNGSGNGSNGNGGNGGVAHQQSLAVVA